MDSPTLAEPNRARFINVGQWIILVPTAMVVGVKVYTKWLTARKFGLEDVLMVAAFLFALAQSIVIAEQINSGFGMPQQDLSDAQLEYEQKMGYISQIFYVLCINSSKLATLSFLTCLCSSRTYLRITQGVSALITAWLVVSVFTVSFQCALPSPWKVLGGTCADLEAFWIVNATADVVSQLVVALWPALLLKDLHMASKSRKWLARLAFIPNILTVPLSILRAVYLVQALHSPDFSYDAYDATLVTVLHAFTAVAAAALPFIKPVIDSLILQPYLVDEQLSTTAATPIRGGFASKFRRATKDSKIASRVKQDPTFFTKPSTSLGSSGRGAAGIESINLGNLTAISTRHDDHDRGRSDFDFGLHNAEHSRNGSTEQMVIRQTNTFSLESHPK